MTFKRSLNQGAMGESLFFEANCSHLLKTDGRKGDFVDTTTGQTVELKTDFWSMDKTPNYFFERYSDMEKKTPGGPWQSLEHGANVFVYFYVQNMTYMTFDTRKLVDALEGIIPSLTPTEVQNKGYTTLGYRVPRALLANICDVHKINLASEKVSSRGED